MFIFFKEILYFIEPYDFPDWYFNVKDNDIFSFYKNGLKFSIVKGLFGNPQYISFKLTNEKKYLRHQSFILRLHDIIYIWPPDAEFILQESNFPGFIKIKSTGSLSTRFLRFYGPNLITRLEEKQDTNEYDIQTSYKFIASDLRIKKIDDINRYSVNVTVDDFPPIWDISDSQNPFIVKYTTPNNQSIIFNVTGSSIVITNLDSYTFYKFSAGVQNEFGMIVFGIVSDHQTDEDFPTGPPLNFTVAQVNFSTLLLSWANVDYLKRKGIIQMYNYSCQDYEVSIWNNVPNSTFQVTVNNLKASTTYNCSIAACTKAGCGVRSFGSNKTLEGNSINASVHGFFKGNNLNLSLEVSGYGYKVTLEYFLPPFATFLYESISLDLIKSDFNKQKYIFPDLFLNSSEIIHNISMTLRISNCPQSGMIIIDIPVRLSFQSTTGTPRKLTKAYRNSLACMPIKLINAPRRENALPEYYGRGIYWEAEKSIIYVCMNQHAKRVKSACYYSKDYGHLWAEMDTCVGSILGHNTVTKELYAIHRDQKTYLHFHKSLNKWLVLTNQQFKETASNNINETMRTSVEENKEQFYNIGLNQWMGNTEGLFYRNHSSSNWLQRINWFLQATT